MKRTWGRALMRRAWVTEWEVASGGRLQEALYCPIPWRLNSAAQSTNISSLPELQMVPSGGLLVPLWTITQWRSSPTVHQVISRADANPTLLVLQWTDEIFCHRSLPELLLMVSVLEEANSDSVTQTWWQKRWRTTTIQGEVHDGAKVKALHSKF